MTSIYGPGGKNLPCTVIQAGPCVVTQVRNPETDGYRAVQLAYGDKKEKHSNKAEIGHFKKANTSPKREVYEFRNFRSEFDGIIELGKQIAAHEVFKEGDFADAIAYSKGRGFQGVVKRHGFSGVGESTHGQHNRLRAPGSLGNASFASRVHKGKRMAGRMGGKRVKLLNVRVIKLMPEQNLIVVSGSIPGAKNSTIILAK